MTEPFPDFIEFRKRFWGRESFWYHKDAYAHIESSNRLLMLVHPGATKTMTWAIEYSAYKLMVEPNFRILVVQKSAEEATKVVQAVQDRLASEEFYHETLGLGAGECPICIWGPFRPGKRYRESASWGKDHFRVQGFASGEKDYSMQAKGAGSASLSVRADLIIVDDMQEPGEDNPQNTATLLRWVQQTIITRIYPEQKLIVLGSRLGPTDIYGRMLDDPEFEDWPVVRYPAIMKRCRACVERRKTCRHAEKTRMLVPELRDYPRPAQPEGKLLWDYDGLKKRRKEASPAVWWTSYMMAEGDFTVAIFKKEAIEACYSTDFSLGEKPPWVTDVFLGCDPAIGDQGYCAIITWGLNRKTGQRVLIDIFNRRGMRNYRNIQRRVVEAVAKHGVQVAAIELASQQGSISDDPEFVRELRALGCKVVTYATRTNMGGRAEHDEYDISSIGALFDEGLITIPYQDAETRLAIKPYVDQLLDWRPKPPGSKSWSLVRDMVMATLFAESQARDTFLRARASTAPRKNTAPAWARNRIAAWRKTA